MQKLNLDALVARRHSVEKNGQTYEVKPITSRIATMFDEATNSEGSAKIRAFGDVVSALVPTMPRVEVDDLTIGQLVAIVQLASTQVDTVEAAANPNAAGPAAAPAPGSTTLSETAPPDPART